MTAIGLCATTRVCPDAHELASLGIGAGNWLRIHSYSLSEIDVTLRDIPADINIILTPNNELAEVGNDWVGWEDAMRQIADRFSHRVQIVGCGVELDLWHLQPPVGQPDPRLTPSFAADLVKRASPILRPAGIKVAMSSVASGSWPAYLADMARHCAGAADLADLHLYAKILNGIPRNPDMTIWQHAAEALREAERISGLPVIASEAGIKVDDAGGLEAQAQWAAGLVSLPAELVCSWCWHDRMASPGETGGQAFGARGLDNQQKPLWFALQHQFGGPSTAPTEPPAEYVLGFKAWHDLEPGLIGDAVRNERNMNAPGWQSQPTAYGVLDWVEGKGHRFTTHDGRVYEWQESWTASVELP